MGTMLAGCFSNSGSESSHNQKQVTTPTGITSDENTVQVQGQTFSPGSVTTKEG